MSQPLRTILVSRQKRKPNRRVAFSAAKPSMRIISPDYTSWPNGETSESPSQHDIINAKALTKQALDAAAAEEKRDWERSRTGRRPSAMQERQRVEVRRARAQSSAAALQEMNASRRYEPPTQYPSVNGYANAPPTSRVHRKPVAGPQSHTPMRNPDLNRSAPDLRRPGQGMVRARSSSNVEQPLREPSRHVGNVQNREKIEMKVVGGLRMAKGFAKKVAGQVGDRLDSRHVQNG